MARHCRPEKIKGSRKQERREEEASRIRFAVPRPPKNTVRCANKDTYARVRAPGEELYLPVYCQRRASYCSGPKGQREPVEGGQTAGGVSSEPVVCALGNTDNGWAATRARDVVGMACN